MELHKLGITLKIKRSERSLTSADVAEKLGLTPSYYSRLENGKEKPSLELLGRIAKEYRLPLEDLRLLERLAGHSTASESQGSNTVDEPVQTIKLNVDAAKLPVLFSDSAFITVSKNEVVFDFAQKLAQTDQQQIVSRIGVSIGHAEDLYKLLGSQLDKARNMN